MRPGKYVLKRVYDEPTTSDGARVLVDRLWPRGISKEKAKIALWLKDIAPSDALRRKIHGRPEAWDEFIVAYHAELGEPAAVAAAESLRALRKKGVVTLLYASRNEERNNAVALKDWLEGRH